MSGGARGAALRDFIRSVRGWARLVAQRRLHSPDRYLRAHLRFGDGSESFVFRETAVRDAPTPAPALLVIQFRLGFLASNRLLHAVFRRECALHTPLFAGFPGFRSKLWLDDVETGVYRGVYEWQDGNLARAYARRMVGLLAPFSNAGTARYHVVDGVRRDDFLRHPDTVSGLDGDSWWRLSDAIRPPAG